MAVEDAYGAEESREGEAGSPGEVAYRTERITRSTCRARGRVRVPDRGEDGRARLRRPQVDRLAGVRGDAQGGDGRWRPSAILTVAYQPVLIDATYAGLMSGATDAPLVIPALNRDGDCLSDLVLPMFGSIAGAESVLLAFDDEYATTVAMAEAPHGTAPALWARTSPIRSR